MQFFNTRLVWLVLSVALLAGCGESGPPPIDNLDQQAKAKVEAANQLADAMAKDPTGLDARAAMEVFRNQSLDVTKHPQEAAAIAETYRTRIKGKYQGDVAVDAAAELGAIDAALKASK